MAARNRRVGNRNPYRQGDYQTRRKELLAGDPTCEHCGRRPATVADHQPPLALHEHLPGTGCCTLVPSCASCSSNQGGAIAGAMKANAPRVAPVKVDEPPPVELDRFRVPWLVDLIDSMPSEATWPRLMTAPHPDAVGSYGKLVEERSRHTRGFEARWWKRLAWRRLLEHDAEGRLCWRLGVLTVARQVGKTWGLADLCDWRMHAGELLGGEQTVLSTGKDVAVVREMQRLHRLRAKLNRPEYKVREVNGQEEIERLLDGSRWMVRAKEGVYGITASLATVDEAWKVLASVVDDGIEPTTVEARNAQILLVSTAHRRATALMVGRRARAMSTLHEPKRTLLLEWSAPPDAELDDREGWRMASPHWSAEREELIAERLEGALAGESDDVDEPDPLASFRGQWLNQWPQKRLAVVKGDELLDLEAWTALRGEVVDDPERIYVAVEDYAGQGAGIAAVCRQPDGRLGLDAWTVPSWSVALEHLNRLAQTHELLKLTVGASLLVRLPPGFRAAHGTSTLTRSTLPLMRELVADEALVHDSAELDDHLDGFRVVDAIGGMKPAAGPGRTDLVRAASWALAAAHRPRRRPIVHAPETGT